MKLSETVNDLQEFPMPHEPYSTLIETLLGRYLSGEFLSKEALQRAFATEWQRLSSQTTVEGELLERCLAEREQSLQAEASQFAENQIPAKVERSRRGLKMLQKAWEELATQNQNATIITAAAQKLVAALDSQQTLLALLEVLDLNRTPLFTHQNIEQLAAALKQSAQNQNLAAAQDLNQVASGLKKGLAACRRLQSHVTGWIFDAPAREAGFQRGQSPWEFWAKKLNVAPPQTTNAFFQAEPAQPSVRLSLTQKLFKLITQQQLSIQEWATQASTYQLSDWIELILVMRFLQRGLVSWFDQQAYDTKVGPKLSISSYLTFASIWSELAIGTRQLAQPQNFSDAYFQITLQILRSFAQQSYFPLYGGVFAAFDGGYLNMTLDYLDVPLKQVEGTHEKARILTLLGYSQRALGRYQQALDFHQQALDIARTAKDQACEIANLNHLSRTHISLKEYAQAIDDSQRALILSREQGDRRGEANSLTNLGFSQVCAAQQLEQTDPDRYVISMRYLEQGLEIAEKLNDLQSQALCHSSLGIAHLTLSQPQEAVRAFEAGLEAANLSGDSYLKGLNFSNLAEAFYVLEQPESAIYYGCLGMYLLKQIESPDWSQAAGLLTVIKGKVGEDAFQDLLQEQRPRIIQEIGVDGYDFIPELLAQY